MPIRHQLRPDLGLVLSKHTGMVSDAEFLESYRALLDDPEYDLGLSRLVDLRDADSSARSSEALRSIATHLKRRYKGSDLAPRTAVVAPRDLSFGLARMYQAFSEVVPGDVVVFRSVDAALAWLGVSDEAIPEVRASEGLDNR